MVGTTARLVKVFTRSCVGIYTVLDTTGCNEKRYICTKQRPRDKQRLTSNAHTIRQIPESTECTTSRASINKKGLCVTASKNNFWDEAWLSYSAFCNTQSPYSSQFARWKSIPSVPFHDQLLTSSYYPLLQNRPTQPSRKIQSPHFPFLLLRSACVLELPWMLQLWVFLSISNRYVTPWPWYTCTGC